MKAQTEAVLVLYFGLNDALAKTYLSGTHNFMTPESHWSKMATGLPTVLQDQ